MKKAFTLIELLVVIAIIALLLAILLPSLTAVKQLASSVVCASNEKQILTAWHLYATENDSRICGPETGEYIPAIGKYDWVEGQYGNITYEQEIEGTAPSAATGNQGIKGGALYPYYEDHKLVHCPADKRYRNPPTVISANPGGDGAYRTYSFIMQMNSRHPAANAVSDGWLKNEQEICRKITDISNPGSKYMLIEENDNRGINAGSWVMDLRPATMELVDPFAIFHNMRSILGFADGHAEKIVWKDGRTEEFSKGWDEGKPYGWMDPMPDNVDLQWLSSNYAKKGN